MCESLNAGRRWSSLERLEPRTLLAAVPGNQQPSSIALVDVRHVGNTLLITGSEGRDVIRVEKVGSNFVVTATRAVVTCAPTWTRPIYSNLVRTISDNDVARVEARLAGGNDAFTANLYTRQPVRVRVYGGDGNDQSNLGSSGPIQVYGQGGNDTLLGGGWSNSGWASVIDGGTGNDYLSGGVGRDSIAGGDGNDAVFGGDFADELHGNAGDDMIEGGFGNDTAYGGAGNDYICKKSIFGSWVSGGDSIDAYGGDGDDIIDLQMGNGTQRGHLRGEGGNDRLIGGPNDDILDGGAGSDTLRGNAGNDTYFANDGEADLIEASFGGGSETIFQDMLDILA
jgi:Ca2+-binding RTX toxin-like protein